MRRVPPTSAHTLSLKEMVDVMGGSDCAAFAEFEDLCVLAFLAVRAPHCACKPLLLELSHARASCVIRVF